jgi:GNAT superfamily N-acetyltransferase
MADLNTTHPDQEIKFLRAGRDDFWLAREAVRVNMSSSQDPLSLHDSDLGNFLADPSNYLVMAIHEGKVVGSLYGYALKHPHRWQPQFLLYEIDVLPDHRNRGVGRRLVESFIDEARQAGAFEVWVLTHETNKPAMAVYAHCGFRRCSTGEAMLEIGL